MEGNKTKILWSSVTPTVESGYGRVTREIVSRLIDGGYDVMNHGYQTRGKLHTVDGTFKMLDCGGTKYGVNVIPEYAKKYKRDILITLFDPWIFPDNMPYLGIPWIPYIPIDAEPVSWIQYNLLKKAFKVVCFSEFAKKELEKVGVKAVNIPHGVDTNVFTPFSKEEKIKLREKFHIPQDAFLIGTNGANQWNRKDFPRMIRIFSKFIKKTKANAYLYIQANPNGKAGRAYNLSLLAQLYGVKDRVKFPEKNPANFPMHNKGMAKMYNTFDVYLSTSRAEGCGLPILEAQACGVPAIVPDNSAQPEWVKGHGWVVPCSDHIVVLTTPQHNKWYLIDIDECVADLEDAYKHTKKREKYGRMAREAMLDYDWDKIVIEKWIPFLDQVHKEMTARTRKMWAENKVFTVRNGTIDVALVNMIVLRGEYSQLIKLSKDDVWLDIGGHIGTFAIDIADKVKKVYSFEPERKNFELLKQNVEENKIKNISIFNKAIVGSEDKEIELLINGSGNTGGHSLISVKDNYIGKLLSGEVEGVSTTVQCENINDTIKRYKINKIKMDCEGAEYDLIKAMDFKGIDEIILEYHFNILGLEKYQELVDYLKETFNVKASNIINVTGQTKIYCVKK